MKSIKFTEKPLKPDIDPVIQGKQKPVTGMLYLVATPIGNLEDISLRALRILKEADIIAAEDTRQTLKLLNHYGISKPLTSYHEHNLREKGRILVQTLLDGKSIALVSDAGSPGISDPGSELVKLVVGYNIPVTMIPGPAALIPGLVLSGMDTGKFIFEGFLPSNKKIRRNTLVSLSNEQRTMVFYEAPHKLRVTLNDLIAAFGDRKVSLARELTKKFEQVVRCTLSEAIEIYRDKDPKGEFVIVVEGCPAVLKCAVNPGIDIIKEKIAIFLSGGMTRNEAMKKIAEEFGMTRRQVYNISLGKNELTGIPLRKTGREIQNKEKGPIC
jgi:16S rRNA (cytidine1402-2'-O)-methyltransferase